MELASLKSVKQFAGYLKKTTPSIHYLVCSAGVMGTPYRCARVGDVQELLLVGTTLNVSTVLEATALETLSVLLSRGL